MIVGTSASLDVQSHLTVAVLCVEVVQEVVLVYKKRVQELLDRGNVGLVLAFRKLLNLKVYSWFNSKLYGYSSPSLLSK